MRRIAVLPAPKNIAAWILARAGLLWYGMVALILFAVQWPMVAHAPQNPDGAEMIMAAQVGGNLHAPAYPLQLWLDRLFILLPFDHPATRLALISLISSIATTLMIMAILGRLQVPRIGTLVGGAFFCFYPTAWYLSLQPEKHILACFWVAVIIYMYLSHQNLDPSRGERRALHAVALGVAAALAFLQHAASLFMMPFILGALFFMLKGLGSQQKNCPQHHAEHSEEPPVSGLLPPRKMTLPRTLSLENFSRKQLHIILLFLASGVLTVAIADFSLFLASSPSAWPDWGKIRNLSDLFALVSRGDFWQLRPKSDPGNLTAYTGALGLFCRDYLHYLGGAVFIPLLGLGVLWRQKRGRFFAAFAVSLLLNLVFLWITRFPGTDNLIGETYLERYAVFLVLLLAIAAGAAAGWLLEIASHRPLARACSLLLCLALTGALYALGHDAANAAKDDTLELFREGLSLSHDPASFYIAGSDLELFTGFPTKDGVRFPLCADFSWSARVLPLLDSRLAGWNFAGIQVTVQLVQQIYAAGGRVMISDPKILNGAPSLPWQRGLFWYLAPDLSAQFKQQSLQNAGDLCPVLAKFDQPRPKEGFRYARHLFAGFVAVYANAARMARAAENAALAAAADKVADALQDGRDPARWRVACEEYRLQSQLPKAP